MTIKDKLELVTIKEVLFIILLLIAFVMLGDYLWDTHYPYEPSRIDKITLDKAEAFPGDEVCYQVHGERLLSVPAHVSVEILNGRRIEVLNYECNYMKGEKYRERCFIIPISVHPGKYQTKFNVVYQVSKFREVNKSLMGPCLTVRAKK